MKSSAMTYDLRRDDSSNFPQNELYGCTYCVGCPALSTMGLFSLAHLNIDPSRLYSGLLISENTIGLYIKLKSNNI